MMTYQITLNCRELVFHFNKKHIEDSSIPPWVIKANGTSYYVNHVDCKKGWSTKEIPDNPSTKGALKIKRCTLKIDEDGNAIIEDWTPS